MTDKCSSAGSVDAPLTIQDLADRLASLPERKTEYRRHGIMHDLRFFEMRMEPEERNAFLALLTTTPAQAAREPEAWTRQKVENYFHDWLFWDAVAPDTQAHVIDDITRMVRSQPPADPFEKWLSEPLVKEALHRRPVRCSSAGTDAAVEELAEFLCDEYEGEIGSFCSFNIETKDRWRDLVRAMLARIPAQPQEVRMRGPDCACCEQQPRRDCAVPGCSMKDAEWALPARHTGSLQCLRCGTVDAFGPASKREAE
jgi:hypothetical protein